MFITLSPFAPFAPFARPLAAAGNWLFRWRLGISDRTADVLAKPDGMQTRWPVCKHLLVYAHPLSDNYLACLSPSARERNSTYTDSHETLELHCQYARPPRIGLQLQLLQLRVRAASFALHVAARLCICAPATFTTFHVPALPGAACSPR